MNSTASDVWSRVSPPSPPTPQPNPTELAAARPTSGEADMRHRNVFCPFYDSCLDVAVRRGWSDWTCNHCLLVDQTPTPSAVVFSRDRPRE
ncbi:MAG: hypothetical protein ACOZIN_12820 [Myxococcota bacterium]